MEKQKPTPSISVSAKWIFTLLMLCEAVPAGAQQSLETAYRTTGSEVVAAFEKERKVLQVSSAVILDARKEIGYGVVISPDGAILAKASEVLGVLGVLGVSALSVTVDEKNYKDVKLAAIDLMWDVALLKISTSGLVPVEYAPTSDVPQGTWVVANGASSRTRRRLLAGIVSAKPREIPATGGAALGVILNPKSKNVLVEEVNEKSGAKEAGLQKGDVILSIDGTRVKNVTEIAKVLQNKKAGMMVALVYRREKEEVTIDVRLSVKAEMYAEQKSRNDQMSGDFSPRRSGFPRVMQHDILGSRIVQGGPLLDLDGRCLGMNIARANRAESFAIPVEELKELAERLMKQAAGDQ
jgi:serine protease Do